VTFTPQTLPWLLRHELRLTWRRLLNQRGAAWRAPVLIGLFVLAALVLGGPLGVMLHGATLPMNRAAIFTADAACTVFFIWMLSQALAAAIEAFFTRGDLDLLFSSPLDPGKVMIVRCLAIAAQVVAGLAIFVSPLLIPVALVGHLAWLSLYPILAAIGLAATAAGLLLARLLFRLLGPRRARIVAQLMAVALGGGFFIAGQLPNLFGLTKLKAWMLGSSDEPDAGQLRQSVLAWPIRAFQGDVLVVTLMLVIGGVIFSGVTLFIGRRFATDAAAASGASVPTKRRGGAGSSFVGGVVAVTIRKELRLLARDITLVAAVLFRLVYLLPVAFVLVRNAGRHVATLMPVGVGGVTFMVGQTVLTLAMIMIAGEEAPDLLLSSPASAQTVRRAKMAASIIPVAVIMAVPFGVLLFLEPLYGLAAILGGAANAAANVLIAARLQKPAPRASFRRRGGGASLTAAMVSLLIGGLISAAVGMAAAGSVFALAPLILATGGLAVINEIKPAPAIDDILSLPRPALRKTGLTPT
jgi:ABC-2 type transport system permease protein